MTNNREKGMSLLEVLVVIAVFAILGILITGSLALTLKGTQKSESIVRARENLDYSLGIIERQIRGASSIDCSSSNSTTINYSDQDGTVSSFSCFHTGQNDSHIASGSANLTGRAVIIMSCVFTCTPASGSTPPSVTVNLTVQDAKSSGIQGTNVSSSTQIYLRNY